MSKRAFLASLLCISAFACGSSGSSDTEADAGDRSVDAGTESTDAAPSKFDAAPDVDFLSNGEQQSVLEAINFDCVFQSCDGDFNWDAGEIHCSTNDQSCSITFWTIPHDFVGSFDEAKTAAAIGTIFSGDDGSGPYEGRYVDHFEDEDGRVLESVCTLDGYSQVAEVLDGADVTDQLQSHLLDCIFAIEDGMFDLLAK